MGWTSFPWAVPMDTALTSPPCPSGAAPHSLSIQRMLVPATPMETRWEHGPEPILLPQDVGMGQCPAGIPGMVQCEEELRAISTGGSWGCEQ